MIEQNVRVVRCRDDRIWVRMGAQSGCTACDNGQGCGAGLFAKLLRKKPVVIELARKGLEVEPGQMVTLAFPEQVYLKLVLASYGWPLMAAIGGAFAGNGIGNWLQLGPAAVDAATLGCGLLAVFCLVRAVKSRKTAGTMIDSLHMTACHPSITPGMCHSGRPDTT